KRIRPFGMDLTNEMKDSCNENYKALLKETEEDKNQWKHIPWLWIRRQYCKNVKIPEVIYRLFNAILIEILMMCVAEKKNILKFIWNLKGSLVAKTILEKNLQPGRLTLPHFKTYYKTTVVKTGWYWPKDKHIN
ncbi:LORF2 protein, partial [Crocuta crocuta]